MKFTLQLSSGSKITADWNSSFHPLHLHSYASDSKIVTIAAIKARNKYNIK